MDNITDRLSNIHIDDCSDDDLSIIKDFVKLNIEDRQTTNVNTNVSMDSIVDCLVNDMEKITITNENIQIKSSSTGKILTIPLRSGMYAHEMECISKPLHWIESF